jgi:hypothetical protein
MHGFIDPRTENWTSASRPLARATTKPEELAELHSLCRDGRLYDVERWISHGRPLQVVGGRGRQTSTLEIALEAGNHSLVLLLLSNGYDANQELGSPLDLPLRVRRFDLVQLLLFWGADPHRVDLDELFGTYRSDLFEQFRELGVDLTDRHALAEAIAYHTSNKPLLGFAKRHRLADPKIQKELDVALAHHAAEGNEKGVQLCLWAGANSHVPVPSLRFGTGSLGGDDDAAGEDGFAGYSAIYEACQSGHSEIFNRLGPDPAKDDFEELWRAASDPSIIQTLARHGLPKNVGGVIQHHLWWATFSDACRRVETLRRIFAIGVRWECSTAEEIASLRRSLFKASDQVFVDLMKLLATEDYCSPEVLKELARTPSMRARMTKVGFIPSADGHDQFNQVRPTRSREVQKKFGATVARPKTATTTSVPRSVVVGAGRSNGSGVRLTREELFDRVWSTAVSTLAKEWGLSGPGLKKVCRRLAIPVPPRGYWAKLKAGRPVRRPKLPVPLAETS